MAFQQVNAVATRSQVPLRAVDMLPRSRGLSQPDPMAGPVAHVLMGAASGILAMVGIQYLLVRWGELGVDRACRTIPPE